MKVKRYFSIVELALWSISVFLISLMFFIFDGEDYMTLAASLIGVSSLILNAKGNPVGQMLMVVFSVLYGIISFTVAYYGEMVTYLGMTMPMAVFSLIAWLKNPYNGNRSEVRVNKIKAKEVCFMILLAAVVTGIFYFVLKHFNTVNLLPSTISVTTSFLAAYLTFRRDPRFALAYAANDVVLIVLWAMASKADISYLSVLICFIVFLVNDIYGFISWRKMQKRQSM